MRYSERVIQSFLGLPQIFQQSKKLFLNQFKNFCCFFLAITFRCVSFANCKHSCDRINNRWFKSARPLIEVIEFENLVFVFWQKKHPSRETQGGEHLRSFIWDGVCNGIFMCPADLKRKKREKKSLHDKENSDKRNETEHCDKRP